MPTSSAAPPAGASSDDARPVLRAPHRSRDPRLDDPADHAAAVAYALTHGVCATGPGVPALHGADPGVTEDLDAVLDLLARADPASGGGERAAARVRRFAELPHGTFAWTREPDSGDYRLGRVTGPWRYVASPEAGRHDLPHQRPCTWLPEPVPDAEVPEAVHHTFARGGRNLQRIRPGSTPGAVEPETADLWRRLAG